MRNRKKPAHGVRIDVSRPTIVYLTVCTKNRIPWLALPENHEALRQVWQKADAWVVGRYVVMPDHLHLFAAPGRLEIALDDWVACWKSWFTMARRIPAQQWQSGHWDTRVRSGESYDSKWEYVRNNPVRAGLVTVASEWPFQGELNALPWS
jgi:putative transposase